MSLINIFRIIAFLEGLSYVLLLFIAVPIKYIYSDPSFVKMLGMPHGLLFMGYLALSFVLRSENQWIKNNFFGILIASVIPFGTFVVENKLKKHQ
jgi:integral membrane protein